MYNIVIGIVIALKLLRLIKMCLNETYSSVQLGKCCSEVFRIKNDFKQGEALSPWLFNFF